MSTITHAEILETAMEVRLSGSPAAVWKALTKDIGTWWPAEFYSGGKPGKRNFILDAAPGGRMHEEWEGGGGALWATVAAVDPAKLLQVMGTTFPNWGGPSFWFGTWKLEAEESSTILTFNESTLGRISDSLAAEKEKGWRFLFGSALKSHVEGGETPQWQD